MPRLILFLLLTVTLAACSQAGPYGYGYAVNGRPSLSQLSIVPADPDNPFRADLPRDAAIAESK